jgi:hypothetical protein
MEEETNVYILKIEDEEFKIKLEKLKNEKTKHLSKSKSK